MRKEMNYHVEQNLKKKEAYMLCLLYYQLVVNMIKKRITKKKKYMIKKAYILCLLYYQLVVNKKKKA